MQNSSAAQFHDYEYVKSAESGSDHDEEVTRHNHLGVVVDEAQPTLLWVGSAHWAATAQVLRHGAGRDPNPELQLQFVGDAFFSPDRILGCHPPDQLPQVLGKARSSGRLRLPTPKQAESLAVPSDERIRLYNNQRFAPREHSAQSRHHPPRGVIGSPWSDLPRLEERQLFPDEEIFRS